MKDDASMTVTFASWPIPPQGRITFTASCPCGTDALWEQLGVGEVAAYRIHCGGCPLDVAPPPEVSAA
jgi:hypothetical protein